MMVMVMTAAVIMLVIVMMVVAVIMLVIVMMVMAAAMIMVMVMLMMMVLFQQVLDLGSMLLPPLHPYNVPAAKRLHLRRKMNDIFLFLQISR